MRNLNKLGPFMEAFFISLGCLIPIFLNIAITRDSMNNNNRRAWMVKCYRNYYDSDDVSKCIWY